MFLAVCGLCVQTVATCAANSDWPCRQILVNRIALPTVWAGPPIDDIDWKDDAQIAAFAARLAARRMPVEDAQRMIEDFSKTLGREKAAKLTSLFAALFEILNNERSHVIAGLERFGRRQKELADKIRSDASLMRSAQNEPRIEQGPAAANDNQPAGATAATSPSFQERLQWDVRIFEDRRRSIGYACEVPAIIEQRLFALARAIQKELD
jgi:hypothetical protein